MTALYVILAILIFGVLIAIHEFGHFSAAKLCGVRVEEFAVGMGPALWKKQKGETLYSLRAIPFGGYCAMTGEDGESDDPRAFANQKVWKRLIILAAGSFNNFLLGFLIVLIIQFSAGTVPNVNALPVIGGFMEGCPYESAEGFQVGDRILSINGQDVASYPEAQQLLSEDGLYDFVLERDGKRIELKDYDMRRLMYPEQEKAYFGLLFAGYIRGSAGENLKEAWETTKYYVRLVWESLGMLIHGEAGVNDLAGPVQIVDMMATAGAEQTTTRAVLGVVFSFGAFIAVNLAVMNMLPIPALDGGRVFLLLVTALIEAVTRKKINPKYEAWIHAAGMVLLLALMALITFNDVWNLIKK
jgi:regulator of sigma E protease